MIWATVITDASFSNIDKSAGWAAWINVDGLGHSIKRYSSFSRGVATSLEAEAKAVINGVWLAKMYGAEAVLVQTDCMTVVHLIDGTTKKAHRLIRQWNTWKLEACIQDVLIRAKHVKGHTQTKDARSYVNRWCDKMANRARKS